MAEPDRKQSEAGNINVRIVTAIDAIGADTWDRLAKASTTPPNPFISYAFLKSLEESQCVGPDATGWLANYIALENEAGDVIACLPSFAKLHSRGEYVFDYVWADAYHRAGGHYYPKLQVAVPFTPVPGPRLLFDRKTYRGTNIIYAAIAAACKAIAEENGLSSAHITFCDADTCKGLEPYGFLTRIDQQFHWSNDGYGTFDDFLATLSSRKRKAIRRERTEIRQIGLTIRHLSGNDITEDDWDTFFAFYTNTSDRKWGEPYLNRSFFSSLGDRMAKNCILMFAEVGGETIAGALHIVSDDCIYGRYWGCKRSVPFLHFELCYYQAMEYAIEHRLSRAEAGAQGEHKLLRGYLPTTTYSAHWFADPRLAAGVARFLAAERDNVNHAKELLSSFAPFKKQP